MSKINFHITFTLVLIALLMAGCQKKAALPPSVLLIITDDQGWGDVGFHGNTIIETPTLDRLSKESVVLVRFYVSAVCAPSRASILTGRYHLSTGTSWVTHRTEVMRSEEITIAELLKANGYSTAYFGKWHNGSEYPHDALGQGFDKFFGFSAGHCNNYFDTRLEYNNRLVNTHGYLPDVLTDSILAYLASATRPFFSVLALNTPHSPFQVPDSYFKKYKDKGLDNKNACVYGMCENIDDNVKRILKALEENKIRQNTVLIFLSDNGPNGHRYNGGFKGIKAELDEGGVRVPCLINYPGRLWSKGKRSSKITAHIDLFPTIAEICGTNIPDSLDIQGISLVNYLKDSLYTLPDRKFFSHQVRRIFADVPGSVRTQNLLLVLSPEDTSLYNIAADPFQQENILDQNTAQAINMSEVYNHWLSTCLKKGISPPPISIGYTQSPVTVLPAPDALLKGKLGFKGIDGWANDWITNWTSMTGTISWEISIAAGGTYIISLDYTCPLSGIGSEVVCRIGEQQINFSIDKEFIPETIPSPDRIPRDEVYEQTWGELSLGAIKFQRENYTLQLYAKSIPHDYVADIKSITITKI
jgi:arylsulfatase A-like enzyme